MSQQRIGELLKRTTRLCEMDVEEILHEQHVHYRPFGEIALEWGMCTPQDVWQAWFNQLGSQSPLINLEEVGIDAQAVAHVPRDVAMQYALMPLRVFGNHVVAAIPPEVQALPTGEIWNRLQKNVRFVRAAREQISRAIDFHYGALCASA